MCSLVGNSLGPSYENREVGNSLSLPKSEARDLQSQLNLKEVFAVHKVFFHEPKKHSCTQVRRKATGEFRGELRLFM